MEEYLDIRGGKDMARRLCSCVRGLLRFKVYEALVGCAVYMGVGGYGDSYIAWFIVATFTVGERVSRSGFALATALYTLRQVLMMLLNVRAYT